MFEDALELAENKLLLLYIFYKIKLPISNIQITQIILENNFINYFTLQQYMTELVASNLLKPTEQKGKHRLVITQKGDNVLSLFKERISENKMQLIDNYLENHLENIKKELRVSADYTIENNNNYLVNLTASEDSFTLIDIKLSVASNKRARDLCTKWKNNPSELYTKIINLLIDD
jgi:predicted transcriptional regulator